MTTKSLIIEWLDEAKEKGATHLIIMCDTFSYDDYPVYVMPDQFSREEAEKRDGKNMQQLMEVYNLSMNWSEQICSDTLVRNY